MPSFNGPQISGFGSFTSGPDFVLFVTAAHIEARVGTGSGADLKLRTFEGSGVISFDGAVGTQLDSDLVETTPAGSAVGHLGALTHITGSLDCGNQQPGTADIVVSGPFAAGPLAGALTEPKVTCTVTSQGTFVNIQGIGMAGSTPAIVFVNADPDMLQVVVYTQGAAVSEVYSAPQPGAFTLLADGVQVSADVSLNTPAGASPPPSPAPMLHVEGSATCGQTINQ